MEKVAETAEKVASDIAHALPDNSELKEEVMEIVGIADKVDKDAEKAEEFIHKVQPLNYVPLASIIKLKLYCKYKLFNVL